MKPESFPDFYAVSKLASLQALLATGQAPQPIPEACAKAANLLDCKAKNQACAGCDNEVACWALARLASHLMPQARFLRNIEG